LLTLRWAAFREKGQHYKLLEFCYVANLCALYYLWVSPHQHQLFQIVFLASNGPMAWTILALNQPLLFHSWQHLTSIFIHICPMLLTYTLRWHPSETFSVCADPLPLRPSQLFGLYMTPACSGLTPLQLLYNAVMKFYVLWTLFFFVLVFVILADKVEKRKLKTLWDQVAYVPAMEKIFARFIQFGVPRQSLTMKAIYMGVHLVFAITTMGFATLFWYNQLLHFFFVCFIGALAAWSELHPLLLFTRRPNTLTPKSHQHKTPPKTDASSSYIYISSREKEPKEGNDSKEPKEGNDSKEPEGKEEPPASPRRKEKGSVKPLNS